MLADSRQQNISAKRIQIEKEGPHMKTAERAADEASANPLKKKKK
jgi:hypothetical protein